MYESSEKECGLLDFKQLRANIRCGEPCPPAWDFLTKAQGLPGISKLVLDSDGQERGGHRERQDVNDVAGR